MLAWTVRHLTCAPCLVQASNCAHWWGLWVRVLLTWTQNSDMVHLTRHLKSSHHRTVLDIATDVTDLHVVVLCIIYHHHHHLSRSCHCWQMASTTWLWGWTKKPTTLVQGGLVGSPVVRVDSLAMRQVVWGYILPIAGPKQNLWPDLTQHYIYIYIYIYMMEFRFDFVFIKF